MKLNVKELVLAPVGKTEEYTVDFSNEKLDDDLKIVSLTGSVKLQRLEEEILGQFKLEAKVRLICDRCDAEFEQKIPLKFAQEYLNEGKIDSEEKQAVSKHFEIDLSEPIRQEIIAALPIKRLCKPDCAGICPGCGADLNGASCACKKVIRH